MADIVLGLVVHVRACACVIFGPRNEMLSMTLLCVFDWKADRSLVSSLLFSSLPFFSFFLALPHCIFIHFSFFAWIHSDPASRHTNPSILSVHPICPFFTPHLLRGLLSVSCCITSTTLVFLSLCFICIHHLLFFKQTRTAISLPPETALSFFCAFQFWLFGLLALLNNPTSPFATITFTFLFPFFCFLKSNSRLPSTCHLLTWTRCFSTRAYQ